MAKNISPVSLWTNTGVSIQGIDALSSVVTLVVFAVVIIQLTVLTNVPGRTLTSKTHTHTHICV